MAYSDSPDAEKGVAVVTHRAYRVNGVVERDPYGYYYPACAPITDGPFDHRLISRQIDEEKPTCIACNAITEKT